MAEGAPRQPGALRLLAGDANPELARKIGDALQEPVSPMRITSPPILLGRKLLKKSATRNEPSSVRDGTSTACAA